MRVSVISAAVGALITLSAVAASAQTLGDLARQEAERRKTVKSPAKVFTNDSLKREAPPSTPPPAAPAPAPASASGTPAPAAGAPGTPAAAGAQPTAPAPAPAAPAVQDEAAWRKRMADARDALSRSQTFAEALQSRINALSTDFVNRDDPAQRNVIAAERQKALAELDRVKQDIANQQKAITSIQDDARKAGVPAGWVR